ncbi:MAG: hypothetical protein JXB13_16025 [Phycisphaerae bacterium]|nr:hypothetical protein [Phycisphaerae bacterium]
MQPACRQMVPFVFLGVFRGSGIEEVSVTQAGNFVPANVEGQPPGHYAPPRNL